MKTNLIENLSRRQFIQGSAALTLGFYLPALANTQGAKGIAAATSTSATTAAAFAPNAFLRIAADNSVTIICKHLEMGQGTFTGLATILAEELDANWKDVRVEGAPADASRYNHVFWGAEQGTGGSSSIANSWEQLRKAGATGRAMLVSAAARQWQVPAADIKVVDGIVSHFASKRTASFGELATAAAQETAPAEVSLKNPEDFKLIGKKAARKDTRDKTNGKAIFTQDVQLPDMLVAVVAHAPRFGAKLQSFDATRAKKIRGVVNVVAIPNGVAVMAKDTWSAKKGRDALSITWDENQAFKLSTEQIFDRYHQLATRAGTPVRKDGDPDQAFAQAAKVIKASYDFPYLAHAAMEPLNCVIHLRADGADIWNGVQMQTADQNALAALLHLKVEQIKIHMLYAGGSFGRRASSASDYILEAAKIAQAAAKEGIAVPIKLVWMREDDMRAGYYRPLFHHALEAALDGSGNITGWRHRLVGQSIMAGSPFEGNINNGVDPVSVEGAANLPYVIPHLAVDLHTPNDIPVPVLWWRSVGSSHTAYSTETFFDQLATTAGKDPVALRLSLLRNHPRHSAVLQLVADKSQWHSPLKAGSKGDRRGHGVALHESFGTVVAHVAEVTVKADGSIQVDRVVSALDCGVAINPDNIRSQVEGAIGFALSAALYGEITLKDGQVEQGNFDGYPLLRLHQMPKVEVHIINSSQAPSGIGEPPLPPLAPAVANAIAAATGKRLTRLPFNTAELAV